jgi:hypothetical protein
MRKTQLAEESSHKRRIRQAKAPHYWQMRRLRGAFLCFDEGQKKLAHDKNFPKDLENAFRIGQELSASCFVLKEF